MINNKKLILVCIAIFVLLIGTGIWRYQYTRDCALTSEMFLDCLISGDQINAKKYSAGKVLYQISNVKEMPTAKVKRIDCNVTAHGRGWAKVTSTVELKLSDGTYDAGWYDMALINNNGWKVISIKEVSPVLIGIHTMHNTTISNETRKVFEEYLNDLSSSEFGKSAEWLAGPARQAYEKTPYKSKVLDGYDQLTGELLYTDGQAAIEKFSYTTAGRSVEIAVTFYKLESGWKIVETNAI